MFKPRAKQRKVLEYSGGKMGVSAVPGSGKTHILSYLAAEIIARGAMGSDQEVLVVTLVNSAVENFSHRVASFVKQKGLLPQTGYRVRTLHGLAHDIVRERPALAGLSEGFQIIDERLAEQILLSASKTWLRSHPYAIDEFLDPELEASNIEKIRRRDWPDLVGELAKSVIKQAKDLQLSPEAFRRNLDGFRGAAPLLEMTCEIYADYQRSLTYRGAVDFDDLIIKALQVIQSDPDYLTRLRNRWPYILEDEAQDSSRLQEEILRILTGPDGNWVRVGDTNQAIFETFTTASPQFLRDFLQDPSVVARELPNSGRSTLSIIQLANALIDWTVKDHPTPAVRDALTPPHIEPSPPGDPQPNPPEHPEGVNIVDYLYTPQEEVRAVASSLERWLPESKDQTVAVLVPTNQRGFQLVNELKNRNIPIFEILNSTRSTREAASSLAAVLRYLAEPTAPHHLERVFRAWWNGNHDQRESNAQLTSGLRFIRKSRNVEEFLWPRVDRNRLEVSGLKTEFPQLYEHLIEFRASVQRWQGAALLPIDQLILTLAQDLFLEPADLAVSYKLASILRQLSEANPEWRLSELTYELELVAKNQRRFSGLSQDDIGFDPEQHKGEVVVSTMHKAKGLEWDRVYLMSINNYDFPSGHPEESYISEKWFVRGRLNLSAETLAQLRWLISEDLSASYVEGEATQQARMDYVAERLRLLYVGITRARRDLILTLNTGRQGDKEPAVALRALISFWNGQVDDPSA